MLNNPLPAKFQMRFLVSGEPAEDIRASTEIPLQYRPYLHPFAAAVIEESAGVDIIYQVSQTDGFVICNYLFFPGEDVVIEPYVTHTVTSLQFMMKGSIRCEMAGQGTIWFRAGQFGFLQAANGQFRGWLEKGAVYEVFHIYLGGEQLAHLAPHSPLIAELRRHSEESRTAYFLPSSSIMTSRFYEQIREIRGMPPAQPLRDFTMPAHVTLLLSGALTTEEIPQQRDDDHTLFAAIRAYIQNNLAKELGNSELASDYCISVSKLKYGFKRIYNESLQAHVKRSRLERAKDLISATALPLQRIAQMVGYADYGNFSRRYHAYFGHPPSALKRQ
ncbi:AraC family transcriptional regulator [Chitinophaga sp. YIM B06452]|uniref:helix-turn-helix domain-containing protein n=1 Tax=Chitinophaga sp. YIM B06452 TaxID=3082158 RepID=UPI0031FED8E1